MMVYVVRVVCMWAGKRLHSMWAGKRGASAWCSKLHKKHHWASSRALASQSCMQGALTLTLTLTPVVHTGRPGTALLLDGNILRRDLAQALWVEGGS